MADKIAIIGSTDSFMGFRALGVEVVDPVLESKTAQEILTSLTPEEYAIVFVGEDLSESILELIGDRNRITSQTVTIIPSSDERSGLPGMRIRQLVRRAVGADIM